MKLNFAEVLKCLLNPVSQDKLHGDRAIKNRPGLELVTTPKNYMHKLFPENNTSLAPSFRQKINSSKDDLSGLIESNFCQKKKNCQWKKPIKLAVCE